MTTQIKPYKNSIRQQNSYIESGFYGNTTIQKNLIVLSIYAVQQTHSRYISFNKKRLLKFLLKGMTTRGGKQYELIEDAIKNLMDIKWSYIVNQADGSRTKKHKHWVDEVSHNNIDESEGNIVMELSDDTFERIKANLSDYTIIQIANQFKLKGVYSTKFYDLLKREQTRNTFSGSITFDISYLKECFNVTDKYNKYSHIKDRIFIPCLEEINAKTDLTIAPTSTSLLFKENKSGKTIVSITITYQYDKAKVSREFDFSLLEALVQDTRTFIDESAGEAPKKQTFNDSEEKKYFDSLVRAEDTIDIADGFTQLSLFNDEE